MSENTIIAIITVLGSGLATYLTYRVSMWINKRKIPAEIRQMDASTDITSAQLIEKYQDITARTADDKIKLEQKMKEREESHIAEKQNLIIEISGLRKDVQDLKDQFEIEKKQNDQWKDWARRLVLQAESWGLIPVPFDVEEAKKQKLSIGDFGPIKIDKKE